MWQFVAYRSPKSIPDLEAIRYWRFGTRASALRINTETEIENADARFESVRNVALFVPLSIWRM